MTVATLSEVYTVVPHSEHGCVSALVLSSDKSVFPTRSQQTKSTTRTLSVTPCSHEGIVYRHGNWVSVTTAWRVLTKRLPDTQGRCGYIE